MKAIPLLVLLLVSPLRLEAQKTFVIDRHTIAGGGTSTGGSFAVSGTAGQPDASVLAMAGGTFSLSGGYWPISSGPPAPVPPDPLAITIFDNIPGAESGGFGATTTLWLAGKIGPGTQSHRLDALSLLLSSGNFSGSLQPPSTVRLRIFSHDPVSGKPSAEIGPVMNLSGLTNPITLDPFHLVKWVPATPFILSAGTTYWAVLSNVSGAATGWIHSGRTPTGDAGTFGFTRSYDSGATWAASDNLLNHKMLISAVPMAAPPPAAELAADNLTPIPGGTGNFTGFLTGPGLSGNNLAFYGSGSDGQLGFYLSALGSLQAPSLIASLNTPIPGGIGSFLSFGTEAGIIIVSGNTAVFGGNGSGGQMGIYGTVFAPPLTPSPLRIADTATAIPGGSGTFAGFPFAPGFSGTSAIYTGNGPGGQRGVYASVFAPPQVGPPLRIADTATAIPGGAGNFSDFPGAPAISGENAVFAGAGADGQRGVYGAVFAPPQIGTPLRIVDTTMAIPDGVGNFTDFGSEAGIIIVSGSTAVFGGTGTGGQKGIYSAVFAPPQVGPPARIADTATAIPGGTGNFTDFGEASVSETDIAFLGMGTGGQTGIYDRTGGQLLKVVAVGDSITGRKITGLKLSRGGVFGDPVAFQATFEDGSQGVYRIAVDSLAFTFRITGVEREGSDLRLSFTSKVGTGYLIQSCADLKLGSWVAVPGAEIPGNGGIVEAVIANGVDEAPQFYRVRQLP